LSYYGQKYLTRPERCKNYESGLQSKEDREKAYLNSKKKNLRMVPCPACGFCKGYVFAGSDSGGVHFCYNFEEVEADEFEDRSCGLPQV